MTAHCQTYQQHSVNITKLYWATFSQLLTCCATLELGGANALLQSTEVALASCSSKGRVQARVPGSPVAGWTDTVVPSFRHSAHCRYWPPQLRSASERICVVPCTHNSFSNRSFPAASLGCGTPYHHICGGTWTTDISSMHWKDYV